MVGRTVFVVRQPTTDLTSPLTDNVGQREEEEEEDCPALSLATAEFAAAGALQKKNQ